MDKYVFETSLVLRKWALSEFIVKLIAGARVDLIQWLYKEH